MAELSGRKQLDVTDGMHPLEKGVGFLGDELVSESKESSDRVNYLNHHDSVTHR